MKKFILFFVLVNNVVFLNAQQAIVEDKDGESSLVFPNAGLSFNTTDPKITASFYYGAPKLNMYLNKSRLGVNKAYSDADSAFIHKYNFVAGGAVTGKNTEGVAALFNDGKFTPGGDFAGLFGYNFHLASKNTNESFREYSKAVSQRSDSLRDMEVQYATLKYLLESITRYLTVKEINVAFTTKERNLPEEFAKLKVAFDDGKEGPNKEQLMYDFLAQTLRPAALGFNASIEGKTILANYVNGLIQALDEAVIQSERVIRLDKNIQTLTQMRNENIESIDYYLRHSLLVFGSGKYSVQKFTRYLPDSAIAAKFPDTIVGVGYVKLHLNWILRQRENASDNNCYHILGISLGHFWQDNFDYLTAKDIQHEQIVFKDSLNTGKIAKTKNAKQGTFYNYRSFGLDADYLTVFTYDNFSVLVNPYLRSTFGYAAKDTIMNVLTNEKGTYRFRKGSLRLGTGVYFASPKNVIQGGIYFEYATIPLQKPEVDKDGKHNLTTYDRFKRNFTFGLTVKFNVFKFRYDQMLTNII